MTIQHVLLSLLVLPEYEPMSGMSQFWCASHVRLIALPCTSALTGQEEPRTRPEMLALGLSRRLSCGHFLPRHIYGPIAEEITLTLKQGFVGYSLLTSASASSQLDITKIRGTTIIRIEQ